jgi:hypothetical protein
MTPAPPRDQHFALLFFVVGAIGIPFAIKILSMLHNDPAGEVPLATFFVCYTLFAWGMTLFVGYARALINRPWRWRRLLWQGTVAYNALLTAISIGASVDKLNPVCVWFALLTTLAGIALYNNSAPQKA